MAIAWTAARAAFARVFSGKVADVASGKSLEAALTKSAQGLWATQGFKGSQSLLCGGELDFKMVTAWEQVDDLQAFVGSDAEAKVMDTMAPFIVDSFHQQVRVQPFQTRCRQCIRLIAKTPRDATEFHA